MPSDPVPPPPACTCGRLRRAARALTQLYDDLMAPSGLRVTQFSLLRTLARSGTARMSDLAGLLLLDRTALSRTLEPLAARGLVTIAPGCDGRTREVSLTRAGAGALRAAEPDWLRAQARVEAKLGANRVRTLVALLADMETLHPDSGGPGAQGHSPATGRPGSKARGHARTP
jgi:DNA-binding MarR family transcriptional regulator